MMSYGTADGIKREISVQSVVVQLQIVKNVCPKWFISDPRDYVFYQSR